MYNTQRKHWTDAAMTDGGKDNKTTSYNRHKKLHHSTWFPHNGKLMDISNCRSHSWGQVHATNSGSFVVCCGGSGDEKLQS